MIEVTQVSKEFDSIKAVDPSQISEILVTNNDYNHMDGITAKEMTSAEGDKSVSYKDISKIKEIYPLLVGSNTYYSNSTLKTMDDIDVTVKYKDNFFSYKFLPGKMPAFVQNDLEHLD